jgi:hypothetical protein
MGVHPPSLHSSIWIYILLFFLLFAFKEVTVEMDITYVYRETETSSRNQPKKGYYVQYLSESSSQLPSGTEYNMHFYPYCLVCFIIILIIREEYSDLNNHHGTTFIIHLNEKPYWLSESEDRILGGTEAIVFLMLALLALNHAIALLTALIRQIYSWCDRYISQHYSLPESSSDRTFL